MSHEIDGLIKDVLALDADQRAIVANAIFDSFDEDQVDNDVDDEWVAVATQRLEEMRSGAVELIDADEHYSRLRASLEQR